jgi:hypothetical protein
VGPPSGPGLTLLDATPKETSCGEPVVEILRHGGYGRPLLLQAHGGPAGRSPAPALEAPAARVGGHEERAQRAARTIPRGDYPATAEQLPEPLRKRSRVGRWLRRCPFAFLAIGNTIPYARSRRQRGPGRYVTKGRAHPGRALGNRLGPSCFVRPLVRRDVPPWLRLHG